MPPAIQSTMTVSALALIFSSGGSLANRARGGPAARAERVAALAVFKKSRREQWLLVFIIFIMGSSVNQLELRQHRHRPEQILHAFLFGRRADQFFGQLQFLRR